MKYLAIIAILTTSSFAVAEGIVEVPTHSKFMELRVKNQAGSWQKIAIPNSKNQAVTLPAAVYQYSIQIQSSVGVFKGEFTIEDGKTTFIHRAISPDKEVVYSWTSESSPRGDKYETEVQEVFCKGLFSYSREISNYIFESCENLYQQNNRVGIHATGYMYEKGLNGKERNWDFAADNYKKAYDLGELNAGMSFVLLKKDTVESIEVLKDMAAKGNLWAIRSAAQFFSSSKLPEELELAKRYTAKLIELNDPIGFKTMSYLHFNKAHLDIKEAISAAAYYSLYTINVSDNLYQNETYKKALEESLRNEDIPIIQNEIKTLSDKYVSTGLYIVINEEVFKRYSEKGQLTLVVNSTHQIPLTSFNKSYVLELLPSSEYRRITLLIDGEHEDQITFSVDDDLDGDDIFCIIFDEKRKELNISTPANDKACQINKDGQQSMWNTLNQYLI